MKHLKLLLVIPVLFAFSFFSSKKDRAAFTPVRVYGSWFGKYGNGTGRPEIFYALHFKYTGYVLVESSSEGTPNLGTGKWSLIGDSVKGTYNYVYGATGTFSFAMKLTEGSAIGTGTWGNGFSTAGGGRIDMKKE